MKGIINLEKGQEARQNSSFLLLDNHFSSNGGLVDANVLTIRKRATSTAVLRTAFLTPADFECGGIRIDSNQFRGNVGCKHTQGVMHAYCFDALIGSPPEQI
jgi:hypothetical protein